MSNALATVDWDNTKMDLVKRTIAKGCDDDEVELFAMVCKRSQLDPFTRQIYARKQWDNKLGREVMIIITSIDGFRLTAQRSGQYAGQLGPQWCGPDGVWRDVWTGDGYPFAARVGVLRRDFAEPIWSVAKWDSYVQTYREKSSGKTVVTHMWDKMSDHMLAKCAEALSLRRACPNELSGIYAEEEADQMNNEREPVPPVRAVQPKNDRVEVRQHDANALPAPSEISPKQRFSAAVMAWSGMKGTDLAQARNDAAKRMGFAGASDLSDEDYAKLADDMEALHKAKTNFIEWASTKPIAA
jgi:phage recombination protein Bet